MEFYEALKKTKIFSLASELDCQAMMYCFKTRFRVYKKNEHIIKQGQELEEVVLIVKGSAIVEHIDSIGQLWGTWGGLAVILEVDDFEILK